MSEIGKVVDAHTVRFECRLPASAETVWNHLTRREDLATWLAVAPHDIGADGEVELWFDVAEVPERETAGAVIRGHVTEYSPPSRLAYGWTDPSVDSHVTFELVPEGDATRVVVTHGGLPTDFVSKCGAGWHTHFGVLQARLEQAEPEPFLTTFERVLPQYEAELDRVTARSA